MVTRWNDYYTENFRSDLARMKALIGAVTTTHRRAMERYGPYWQRAGKRPGRMKHSILARRGIRLFISRYRIE